MKKLVVLSGAVLLSLSLYACGQNTNQAASAASEAVSGAVSEVASAAGEAGSAASEALNVASEAAASVAEDASSQAESLMDGASFTLDELSKFNGKDGTKAYIAVEGVVYDVTDSKAWKNGAHNGFEAGKDLTEAMKNAPHGFSKLDNIQPVGVLAE